MLAGVVICTPADAAQVAPVPLSQLQVLEQDAHEEFDVIAQLTGSAGGSANAQAVMVINARPSGEGYQIRFTPNRVAIYKIVGKSGKPIGFSDKIDLTPERGPVTAFIKKREAKITVILDNRIVAQAYDDQFVRGAIGHQSIGKGLAWSEVRYQPMEAIYFADDFMREQADDPGNWQMVEGSWKLTHMPVKERASNPFWYLAKAHDRALSVTGYPFWDNYSFQVSAQAPESGAVGLCFYYQDPENYLLFRWTSAWSLEKDADRKQMVRVTPGSRKVLAEKPGGFIPGQWYQLQVNVDDRWAEVVIDGQVVMAVRHPDFAQGKVGLYAENTQGTYFDDVVVRSWTALRDYAGEPEQYRWAEWQDISGQWSLKWSGGKSYKIGSGEAASICGQASWADYDYQTTLKSINGRPVGIYFYYQDERNHYRLQLAGRPTNRWQLIRVVNGDREIAAQAPGSLQPNRWYQVKVEGWRSYVRVLVDGKPILDNYDLALDSGKVGLYGASGAKVAFTEVGLRLQNREEQEQEAKIPDRFTVDNWMKEWASEWGEWDATDPSRPGLFWNKEDFFGNVTASFNIKGLNSRTGKLNVALAADGKNLASGYDFTLDSASQPGQVLIYLYRKGAQVAQAKQPAKELPEPCQLVVEKKGHFLTASLDEELVIRFKDPEPLQGIKLGFLAQELGVPGGVAKGDHHFDYTFSLAPVDWVIQSGVWGVMNRWSCAPQWSWFGGLDEGIAAIWHKHEFEGDLTLEFYAGIKMDAPKEWGAYSQRFRDINATICANGRTFASGYTFILGGWQNKWTRLLRGDQVVAETNAQQFLLPPQKEGHRLWFYVRMEKRGGDIRVLIDGKPALEYHDPKPLTGKRVAIWTRHNGIMVGRASIYWERARFGSQIPVAPETPRLYTGTISPSPASPGTRPPGRFDNFEGSLGGWSKMGTEQLGAIPSVDSSTADQGQALNRSGSGQASLRITNRYAGGNFAVRAVSGPFQVEHFPWLSFDYNIPAGVKVNWYLRVNTKWYAVLMSGDRSDGQEYATIGRISQVICDGKWHHAQVNLQELLKKQFPDQENLMLHEIVLADWSVPQQVKWYGLTQNGAGAVLHIDNFAFGPKPGRSHR